MPSIRLAALVQGHVSHRRRFFVENDQITALYSMVQRSDREPARANVRRGNMGADAMGNRSGSEIDEGTSNATSEGEIEGNKPGKGYCDTLDRIR